MRSLTEELNRAADAYYNGRGELMSDHEWDEKYDRLRRLEQETGTVLPDSPTHKVSEDNIAGRKAAPYGSRGNSTASRWWPPTTAEGSPRW